MLSNSLAINLLHPEEGNFFLKFAKKTYKKPKDQHWIFDYPSISGVKTKSEKPCLKPVQARTGRFRDSPIAYLTKLLNEDMRK